MKCTHSEVKPLIPELSTCIDREIYRFNRHTQTNDPSVVHLTDRAAHSIKARTLHVDSPP